jgi:S-DNA-T family DNA segregation ATPase FtsK/SpoIIIE
MVLVDFKGGATFAGMSELPHVSAVITNLAQELTLVDRMQDALSGEMVRRQELLREAGNYASIRDYEKARAAGEALEPLPSLFIVVDEFSEMLSAKPEFIDLFVAIGRLGRSLGLHLLLASQRLEEGRLRGLESHLSYRVGLRTFSAAESRRCSACPTPTSCPPSRPGLPEAGPDDDACGSRRRTCRAADGRVRVRATRAASSRGSCPFTISEVLKLRRTPVAEPEPEPEPLTTGDQQSLLAPRGRRTWWATGPEAHQVWLPAARRPRHPSTS